jgi:hypothetical protein
MFNTLKTTFTNILEHLKTRVILKQYETGDFATQAKLRFEEIKRIAENKYNIQAYLRLSLMSHKKSRDCESSLRALGVSSQNIKAVTERLYKSFPKIKAFLLEDNTCVFEPRYATKY